MLVAIHEVLLNAIPETDVQFRSWFAHKVLSYVKQSTTKERERQFFEAQKEARQEFFTWFILLPEKAEKELVQRCLMKTLCFELFYRGFYGFLLNNPKVKRG